MSYREFLNTLETGSARVASKVGDGWVVNTEVKQKILDVFRHSQIIEMPGGFLDKEPFMVRTFKLGDGIRLVPGGTSVRAGAYIGKNVVVMPPSYINVGAYIDDDTMVDSHVLVGSCAQIGKRVHLSAAVQIGGVLEPVGNRPIIVEDDCFIGASAVLVEGILVQKKAVIAPGVVLSASVPIYDLVNEKIYKGEVPENAVVVPGARSIRSNQWGKEQGLSLACAVIVKYRDAKTDASVVLEDFLRETNG